MTDRRAFPLVALLVALTSSARMQQASRDTVSVPASGTARVSGRIVGADDRHEPVRRAIVTLTGDTLVTGRSTISDDDGRFAIDRLPAGTFTVTATRPAFIPTTYGASRPGRSGTAIKLAAGQELAGLTLTMTHGAAIGGVLRDAAGDPAPGMRIEAIRLTHGASGDRAVTAGAALTDDRGAYRLFGLQAGEYLIAATSRVVVGGIGDIGAPSEAEVDALFAALLRKSNAPGPAGQAPPMPGAPGPAPAPAPAAPKSVSFPPSFYPGVVQPTDVSRVVVGAGEDRDGIDFQIQMMHAAAVDGVVVPVRGQNVPQIHIGIRTGGPVVPTFGGSLSGPQLSFRPSDRTFHFANVPPGRYRVTAITFGAPGTPSMVISSAGTLPAGPDPNAPVQWAIADVSVGNDDVSGVTLGLQPALHVTGRLVFDAANRTTPPADPSTLRATLTSLSDADWGSSDISAPVPGVVRHDGTFEFPSVVPGAYRLDLAEPAGWWLRSAIVDGKDALDTGIVVGTSDVANVAVRLTDRHALIAGTLSGAKGAATDYFLVAFSTNRGEWHPPSRRVVSARPTNDGSFELALPPGTYFLAALTDVEPADLEDVAFLESIVPSALTVTIGEGERKIQNLRIGGGL